MPTGPEALFGMPDASGLRPCARTHLKKGLVPHLPVSWGGQQIPLYLRVKLTRLSWRDSSVGETRFGRPWCELHDLVGCVLSLYTSGPRGPFPQALTLLGVVRFIAWRLRCPAKGNADEARGIIGSAGRYGPVTGPTKNGL